MSNYLIIDSDTHVTEPADLWTSRVPAAIKDKVPRVVRNAQGMLAWAIGEQANPLATIGTTATAGHPGGINSPPKSYEEMHPGAANAHERLKYMDQVGIWAMVLYPNVGGFGNHAFLKLGDRKLMLTCVETYNNWQTEWASADIRRLLPITSIPIWDVEASVKEVRRCHALGHKGILFSGAPHTLGCPRISSPHWNPLWEVAVELDMPISFHIGSGNMEGDLLEKVRDEGFQPAFTAAAVHAPMNNAMQMADLIMSGVLVRYPKIKFVSVESGVGWIPFILEKMDYQFKGNEVRKYYPQFDMMPSDYFKRNVFACYWFEQIAPKHLLNTVMGVDNIMFETDFPHPTSLYGEDVWARINGGLGDCDPVVRKKILFDNAQKLYNVALPNAQDEARLAKVRAESKPFWRAA